MGSGPGDSGESQRRYTHRPEFVIIDDEHKKHSESRSQERDNFSAFRELKHTPYSYKIRLISFLLVFVLIICVIVTFFVAAMGGFAYIATLGLVQKLNRFRRLSLSWLQKSLVMLNGFFVAIFSPPYGIAIIIIYFLMQGEKINQEILRRIFTAEHDR